MRIVTKRWERIFIPVRTARCRKKRKNLWLLRKVIRIHVLAAPSRTHNLSRTVNCVRFLWSKCPKNMKESLQPPSSAKLVSNKIMPATRLVYSAKRICMNSPRSVVQFVRSTSRKVYMTNTIQIAYLIAKSLQKRRKRKGEEFKSNWKKKEDRPWNN